LEINKEIYLNKKLLNIVIISYNRCDLTIQCIESIYGTLGISDFIITVVDNGSSDNTRQEIEKKYPKINLIKNLENLGYSKAVNIGVKSVNSDYALVINNDVIFHAGSIEMLLNYIQAEGAVGAVGPQQEYPNGKWQYSFSSVPGAWLGLKNLLLINSFFTILRKLFYNTYRIDNRPKRVGYIDGAVLLIRNIAFNEVDGFDEDYFFYAEEADFCYRLRQAGWKVIFNPRSIVTHLRGGTTTNYYLQEKDLQMLISGKFLFCLKHLTYTSTRLYYRFELIHYSIIKYFWKILLKVLIGRLKKRVEQKLIYFKTYIKLWQEEYIRTIS